MLTTSHRTATPQKGVGGTRALAHLIFTYLKLVIFLSYVELQKWGSPHVPGPCGCTTLRLEKAALISRCAASVNVLHYSKKHGLLERNRCFVGDFPMKRPQ